MTVAVAAFGIAVIVVIAVIALLLLYDVLTDPLRGIDVPEKTGQPRKSESGQQAAVPTHRPRRDREERK